MGISINYRYKFRGTAMEVRELLAKIRNMFVLRTDLCAYVSEIRRITPNLETINDFHDLADVRVEMGHLSSAFQGHSELKHKDGCGSIYNNGPMGDEGYSFYVNLKEEKCESFTVCLYSNILDHEKSTKTWIGSNWTKTNYADDFVKTHIQICEFLDQLKTLLSVTVDDESNYYESGDCTATRNPQIIRESVEQMNVLNQAFADALGSVLKGTNAVVKTPKDR